MKLKLLSDILYKVRLEEIIGSTHSAISSVTFDSRKVKKDSLFVAIKGTASDGHAFIAKAIESGANAESTAENTDTTAQTDSILSQWQEHAWWESQPETAKPGDVRQEISATGLLGALLALTPRSLRRRKHE